MLKKNQSSSRSSVAAIALILAASGGCQTIKDVATGIGASLASAATSGSSTGQPAEGQPAVATAAPTLDQQIADVTKTYDGELPLEVTQSVVEVSEKLAPKEGYHIHLVASTEVNHFLLPQKHIFITRGLLERLDNEAQLAAVLGIDIGLDQTGAIEKLQQQAREKAANERLKGVLQPAVNSAVSTGKFTIKSVDWVSGIQGFLTPKGTFGAQFSSKMELDATAKALQMMAAAKYDPNQMYEYVSAMLKKLPEASDPKDVRFTHPTGNQWAISVGALVKTNFPQPDPSWIVGTDQYTVHVLKPLRPAEPTDVAGAGAMQAGVSVAPAK